MATDQTFVRSQSTQLTECERVLRSTNYIDTSPADLDAGQFDVSDPVPTLDRAAFVDTVRTVATRYGLAVHETDDPYRLVVSLT